MGLLDRLSDTNARGDFNSQGRGARASQGVDYFSSLVPSPDSIQNEVGAASGAGFFQIPPEQFGRGEFNPTPATPRDLSADPLSPAERNVVAGLSTGLGLLGGPFGSVMSKAIDFNTGQLGADVDPTNTGSRSYAAGLGSLAGPNAGYMSVADYTRGHFGNSMSPAQNRESVPVQDIVGVDVTPVEEQSVASAPGSTASWSSGGGGGWGVGDDNFAGTGGLVSGDTNTNAGFSRDSALAADGGMATSSGFSRPVGLSVGAYADGGPIMPGGPLLAMGFENGGPVTGAGNQGAASPQMINMRVNQIVRDPQFQQAVVGKMQQLMSSGQLTPQEVTMMGQIAEASMQNPALYPKLRAFVVEQGMSPLPPAFDPSVIMKVLAISRVLQQSGAGQAAPGGGQPTPPGQVPPTSQAQMQNPNGMANGGFLQGPGTGRSDSIGTVNESSGQPVKVANGEYVIPEHIVRAKGRDFFDKMLRQYADVPKAGA